MFSGWNRGSIDRFIIYCAHLLQASVGPDPVLGQASTEYMRVDECYIISRKEQGFSSLRLRVEECLIIDGFFFFLGGVGGVGVLAME